MTFKCSMDGNATEHSYPRSSDPVSNKWLAISNKTTNTFRVNVGTSQKAVFTPTGADYDPTTGLMELEIGAHSLKAGSSIKLVANSLGFTCDVDNKKAIRLSEGLGFEREGTMKKMLYFKNKFADAAVYGLQKEDCKWVKA